MNGESRSLGKQKKWEPAQGGASLIPAIAEDGTDGAPPMSGGRPGSSLLMFLLSV